MFTLSREFINFQDKLLEVIYKYPEHRVKDVTIAKELLQADIVVRRNNLLYFCYIVEEATLITEEETLTLK